MGDSTITIHTIGHGRHAFADFLALLRRYDIEFICDVRTAARSRWPQFNGAVLAEVLGEAFVTVYTEVKEIEYAEFMKVISPWEREHLLLHV